MSRGRLVAVALATAAAWLAVPAGTAQAHPLGNFTVNHYDALLFSPESVTLLAVVDRAEIPTAQALQQIAPDGAATDALLASAATAECGELGRAVRLTVDGAASPWTSDGAELRTVPGAAGLPTLRLTCRFHSTVDLRTAAQVSVDDGYQPDRVGWREMTADGDGVRLVDSPVPVDSVTDELRQYPVDLLASPVDVSGFSVRTEPGTNTGGGAVVTPGSGDPVTNAIAALDRRLEDLIGERGLTPLVGSLAVLLAVMLGCGHALLPGHGKTVMAAYLAARDGRRRDAITVGATVTATHTVGVLALGVAISVSSTLAGDQVLRWLGVLSGLLVTAIGVALVRAALRRRTAGPTPLGTPVLVPEPALAGTVGGSSGTHVHLHPADDARQVGHHGHDGHHGHHTHDHAHDHAIDPDSGDSGWWAGGHRHGPDTHTHGPGGGRPVGRTGRGGLIGMGIAGGLVPSPSALIVLLASIGLGRTVFGVLLVLAYGLGMAGTLTAVGLLLVRLRGRLSRRTSAGAPDRVLARLARAVPVVTAGLVLVVGLSLVARGTLLS